MRIYGHNKYAAMKQAEESGQLQGLAFPSGKNHVIDAKGTHHNPNKRHESKKERMARRRAEAAAPKSIPIPLLVNQPVPSP